MRETLIGRQRNPKGCQTVAGGRLGQRGGDLRMGVK